MCAQVRDSKAWTIKTKLVHEVYFLAIENKKTDIFFYDNSIVYCRNVDLTSTV